LAKALSVIIPGLNEQFMRRTVEDVLSHSGDETEVIAVCDGSWPEPVIQDHPRLQIIHFTNPVGQRAATNAGARLSTAKYICKLDAHC
jgi:glycosyltransferase involved in cell wall biosynthesis